MPIYYNNLRVTFDYKKLSGLTAVGVLGGTPTALYTLNTATNKKAYITTIMAHNTNTTTENLKIWIGTGTGEEVAQLVVNINLVAGQTWFWDIPTPGIVLDTNNEKIRAASTTTSKVNVAVFGGLE